MGGYPNKWGIFSYLSPEEWSGIPIPSTHPAIREHHADHRYPIWEQLYARTRQLSIASKKLLFDSLLSERLLREACNTTCYSAGLSASIWTCRCGT